MARIVLSILVLGIAGCESVAISLVGAGAGMAMRYGIDGVAYRTFTAPAPAVKEASLIALERMGLVLDATGSFESGEIIYARSDHRVIEIELEPISAKATRMRIAAKNGGLFYDTATAAEIVAQTSAVLSRPTVTNLTVAAPQRPAFHLD
jgi:hypothetical protein